MRTVRALRYCARLIRFGEVAIVGQHRPSDLNGETLHLRPLEAGYNAAMAFEVREIHKYVHTDFALFISHDGYILNPGKWNDCWLDYDFIGAPWPSYLCQNLPTFRVGNSGFCLKSKRFMNRCAELGGAFNPETAGDVFTCQTIRPQLEALGMKYAPVEVASDFSWELNIDEHPGGRPDAFGFHNFSGKHVPQI